MTLRDLHNRNAETDRGIFGDVVVNLAPLKVTTDGRYLDLSTGRMRTVTTARVVVPLFGEEPGPASEWRDPSDNGQASYDECGADLPGASFGRVDLGPIVHGDQPPTQPTMFVRTDGQGIIYRGGRHDIHGEPGSGKSIAAMAAIAEELAAGGRVAVFDYEATGEMFVERGLALGIPAEVIDDPARVAYFNPAHMRGDDITVFARCSRRSRRR
jgi:hypothetical protein